MSLTPTKELMRAQGKGARGTCTLMSAPVCSLKCPKPLHAYDAYVKAGVEDNKLLHGTLAFALLIPFLRFRGGAA